MTYTTFAGQGIDLNGQVLPKADAARTPDQEVYSRSILDTCKTFVGTPNEPAILKGLRAVADKYSMNLTNEALIDILAAAMDMSSTGRSSPTQNAHRQTFPSLEEASFSQRSGDLSRRVPGPPVTSSQQWRMSKLDAGGTYAAGRAQLRSWIEDINARQKMDGKPVTDFGTLLSRRLLPEELKFDPDTDTITLVGRIQPLWHYYWRRALAAYKAVTVK